ncbi:PDZ domain-containing protein [Pseudoduganella sp. FT55W]|uniref:PDZ domain-containing protein n=1 Tax=Duganella rivi TaxID=2666083 RepID=A0A7X4GT32_9BURK|nr:S41 family peptidase [Duganella rivi]MYM69165.1 PDZ domain-containing protein [Duganella rivi]
MKYTSPLIAAAVLTLLAACGGGGGSAVTPVNPTPPVDPTPPVVTPPSVPDFLTLANHCATPRQGTQPSGLPYYDQQGTLTEEMRWLRSFIDESYLWYKEVPATLNMADYKTMLDYFAVLKTPAITASGRAKDRFHFTYPSEVWDEMSSSGVTLGYGITWSRSTGAAPRVWAVTLVEPGSPADTAGVRRGDLLAAVDGADVNDSSDAAVAKRTAGISPATVGETHAFVLKRGDATVSVSLAAQKIAAAAVRNTRVIDTPTGPVGYLQFNDHNAVAEGQLISAFGTLRAAQVNDLVVDMRYNGGGYLVVGAELAYMIAGPAGNGKVFERLQANDKRTPPSPQMFQSKSVGLAPGLMNAGVVLPYLGLKRVTILTTPGTCSASEAVINSLRGIDIEVNLIGGETCGKPYAFVPQANCGITYFAIQTQGVNAKGFGDYADGFQPTCKADDDLGHALGDTSERLLSAALSYRANGVCPAAPLRARSLDSSGPLQLVRPEGKEIAIRHR